MKKILSLVLGLLWALPVLAQENYLSALSLSGTFVTGAEKPYKIPVRVSNGETLQTGYIYADAPVYKLSNYADVVDFQTGKITRNIKKDVFTGAEAWGYSEYAPGRLFILNNNAKKGLVLGASNYYQFVNDISKDMPDKSFTIQGYSTTQNGIFLNDKSYTSADAWKAHLTELYNAGQPLEIYVVTNTPTTEQIDLSTLPQMSGNVTYQVIFPEPQITIATTKYNETKFSPLNTALANAISVVDSVVSNTITQAASIATLQTQKQTRPNDIADDNEKCPAGKKCLLVEDASGVPHWYEIVENAWDLPVGYTQLQWIESTGTQYIDTGYTVTSNVVEYGVEIYGGPGNKKSIFGSENKSVGVKYSGIPYVVDGSVGLYAGSTSSPVANVQFPASQWNTYIVSVTSATALNVSLNGAVRNGTYAGGVQNGKPIYLFTNNGDEAQITSQKISNRIRRFYIKDNNSIVRDFVPAQHGSDVGMYDLVSGQFFTNAGDGEFIAGPVVQ